MHHTLPCIDLWLGWVEFPLCNAILLKLTLAAFQLKACNDFLTMVFLSCSSHVFDWHS